MIKYEYHVKKYTHVRIALLIGLLSFHALSSCVNRNQKLSNNLEDARSRDSSFSINPLHVVTGRPYATFCFLA